MEAKKKGRPSQDKAIRPYSVDRKIAEFIDTLPDGERSRFVNSILVQGIEQEKLSGKYYDYLLIRPDGSVFYVGKGTDKRIDEHEIEARAGFQSHKCNVIRKVWAEGGEIIKQKIAFFDNEEDAYELEVLLVEFFGLENLANKRDGGRGGSVAGWEWRDRESPRIPSTVYRLTPEVKRLIKILSDRLGINETSVLELLIREGAEKRGIMTKQHIIGIEFESFVDRKNALPELQELFENVSQHNNRKQGIHVICSQPIGKSYDEAFKICRKKWYECGWIDPDSM